MAVQTAEVYIDLVFFPTSGAFYMEPSIVQPVSGCSNCKKLYIVFFQHQVHFTWNQALYHLLVAALIAKKLYIVFFQHQVHFTWIQALYNLSEAVLIAEVCINIVFPMSDAFWVQPCFASLGGVCGCMNQCPRCWGFKGSCFSAWSSQNIVLHALYAAQNIALLNFTFLVQSSEVTS